MLICGEKVQDEVLHRAPEEHNSENLKYKQMKSYNATNCVASPLVQEKNSPRIEWLAAPVARNDDVTVQEEKIPGIGRNSHTCRAMSRSRTTTTTVDLTHNETRPQQNLIRSSEQTRFTLQSKSAPYCWTQRL
jgi:hypothetical protein